MDRDDTPLTSKQRGCLVQLLRAMALDEARSKTAGDEGMAGLHADDITTLRRHGLADVQARGEGARRRLHYWLTRAGVDRAGDILAGYPHGRRSAA